MKNMHLCSIDGCQNYDRTFICAKHRYRLKRYNSSELPIRQKKPETCKIDGCNKKRNITSRSSYCGTHLRRKRVFNSYEAPKEKDKFKTRKCSVESCDVLLLPSSKFCGKHRYRKAITGSFNVVNPDKAPYGKNPRKKHGGLSEKQYNDMLIKQNYVCAICLKDEVSRCHKTGKIRRLAVDHCHKTGKNRGLLCGHCNRALGLLKENIDTMLSMIEYKKAHS